MPSAGDHALQTCHAWADDLLLPKPLAAVEQQREWAVVLQSALGEPGQQRVEIRRLSIAEADVRLDFAQVVGSGVLSIAVLNKGRGWQSQLESQVGNGACRSAREIARREAQELESDELESEAYVDVLDGGSWHAQSNICLSVVRHSTISSNSNTRLSVTHVARGLFGRHFGWDPSARWRMSSVSSRTIFVSSVC